MIAGLLVQEGFESIEDLAMTPEEELASIEGFDENVAAELKRRAETFLARQATEQEERRLALGVTDEVAAIEALSAKDLIALGEKGVKTLDDLADLAGDELVEIRRGRGAERGSGERDHHGARVRIGSKVTATLPEPETPIRSRSRSRWNRSAGRSGAAWCGATQAPREAMLRFVVGPDQTLVFDAGATLPGRGLWLSAAGDVVEMALKRGVFSRAAKQPVTRAEGFARSDRDAAAAADFRAGGTGAARRWSDLRFRESA